MGKVKDDNYYITYGWMINQLQLKGNELQIFAIIYGFSQNNKKDFNGATTYLAEWIGGTKRTVITVLQKLVEKKLLIKEVDNVGTPNIYKINPEIIDKNGKFNINWCKNFTSTSEKISSPQCKNFTSTSENFSPNNNIDNNIDNNINNIVVDVVKKKIKTADKKQEKLDRYRDKDFKEVSYAFSNNIHPINGMIEADMLISLLDDYGKSWVLEGIKEMVRYHGTTLAYLSGILSNWKKYGFKNKKQVKQINNTDDKKAEYGF